MNRGIAFIVGIGLVLVAGCNNRVGPFAGNARVPAPGTYQLRIPSLANNPYYTPGGSGQGNTLGANLPISPPLNSAINPNVSAPTIDVAQRDLNGWTLFNQSIQPPNSNAPNDNLNNLIANRGGLAAPQFQVASSSTLQNGSANPNRLASAADPGSVRVDSTRLGANDVTNVRAPVAGSFTGSPTAGSAPPLRYAGNIQVQQGIYPPAGAIAANSNGFQAPQQPARYAAQPIVGAPRNYQSPYIRNAGTFASGNGAMIAPQTGWVSREGENQSNR